jgi:hypothetical protein
MKLPEFMLSTCGFLRRRLCPSRRFLQLRLVSSNSTSKWNLQKQKFMIRNIKKVKWKGVYNTNICEGRATHLTWTNRSRMKYGMAVCIRGAEARRLCLPFQKQINEVWHSRLERICMQVHNLYAQSMHEILRATTWVLHSRPSQISMYLCDIIMNT